MSTTDTVSLLGGTKVFGRPVASELDLVREVAQGFPVQALESVLDTLQSEHVSRSVIYSLVGTSRTLQRKQRGQLRLSRDESDRLARLARMTVRANEALGSATRGQRWLGRPNRALGGLRPLELLASDAGAKLVEELLGRIEHGVFA